MLLFIPDSSALGAACHVCTASSRTSFVTWLAKNGLRPTLLLWSWMLTASDTTSESESWIRRCFFILSLLKRFLMQYGIHISNDGCSLIPPRFRRSLGEDVHSLP